MSRQLSMNWQIAMVHNTYTLVTLLEPMHQRRCPQLQVVLVRACLHCGGGGGRDPGGGGIACDSLDCGVFFERVKARAEAAAARALCDAGLALL